MGKIYAYHRFSTDEQDAQSQRNIISMPNQKGCKLMRLFPMKE